MLNKEKISKEDLIKADKKLNDLINQANRNIEKNKLLKAKTDLNYLIKKIRQWSKENLEPVVGLTKERDELENNLKTEELKIKDYNTLDETNKSDVYLNKLWDEAKKTLKEHQETKQKLQDKIVESQQCIPLFNEDPYLTTTKTELNNAINNANDVIGVHSINDLNNDIFGLNVTLQKAKKTIDDYNKQKENKLKNLDKLIKQVSEWKQTNLDNKLGLIKEGQELQKAIDKAKLANNNLYLANIDKEDMDLRRAKAKAEADKNAYEKTKNNLNDLIAKAKEIINSIKDPYINKAKQDLQEAINLANAEIDNHNIDQLKEDIENLNNQINLTNQAITKLKEDKTNAMAKLRQGIDEATGYYDAFNDNKNKEHQYDLAVSYTSSELNKLKDINKEATNLQDLLDAIDYLNNIKAIWKAKVDIIDANKLADQMKDNSLASKKQELVEAINALETKINDKNATVVEIDDLDEKLLAKMKEAKNEFDNFNTSRNKAINELNDKLKEAKDWLKNNMANKAGLSSEKASLQNQIDKASQNLDNLNAEQIKQINNDLSESLNKAKKETLDYNKAKENLDNKLNEAQDLLPNMNNDPYLQEEKDKLTEEIQKALNYKEAKTTNQLNEDYNDLEITLNNAKAKLEEYKIKKNQALNTMNNLIIQVEKWKEDNLENKPGLNEEKNDLLKAIDKAKLVNEDRTLNNIFEEEMDLRRAKAKAEYDKGVYDKNKADLQALITKGEGLINQMSDPVLNEAKTNLETKINEAKTNIESDNKDALANKLDLLNKEIEKAENAIKNLNDEKAKLVKTNKSKINTDKSFYEMFAEYKNKDGKYDSVIEYTNQTLSQLEAINNPDSKLVDLQEIKDKLPYIKTVYNAKIDIINGKELAEKISDSSLANKKGELQALIDEIEKSIANNGSKDDITALNNKLKTKIKECQKALDNYLKERNANLDELNRKIKEAKDYINSDLTSTGLNKTKEKLQAAINIAENNNDNLEANQIKQKTADLDNAIKQAKSEKAEYDLAKNNLNDKIWEAKSLKNKLYAKDLVNEENKLAQTISDYEKYLNNHDKNELLENLNNLQKIIDEINGIYQKNKKEKTKVKSQISDMIRLWERDFVKSNLFNKRYPELEPLYQDEYKAAKHIKGDTSLKEIKNIYQNFTLGYWDKRTLGDIADMKAALNSGDLENDGLVNIKDEYQNLIKEYESLKDNKNDSIEDIKALYLKTANSILKKNAKIEAYKKEWNDISNKLNSKIAESNDLINKLNEYPQLKEDQDKLKAEIAKSSFTNKTDLNIMKENLNSLSTLFKTTWDKYIKEQ
ncbi:hypothetical protein [[Mycoplasma] falconis]|uniref:hypothetical protein n=1 Tax=[Mycoplasma] falconis TaxID=92403 RepID=UPI0014773684|nr:hypothetical protein [[Mycoplasma] falconis]